MKLLRIGPRAQFNLRALFAAVSLAAVFVWGWTVGLHYLLPTLFVLGWLIRRTWIHARYPLGFRSTLVLCVPTFCFLWICMMIVVWVIVWMLGGSKASLIFFRSLA